MADVARGKYDFDVTGHYARPDVFRLLVNESPTPAVSFRRFDHQGAGYAESGSPESTSET